MSEWRRDITSAPMASNSAALTANLNQQITSRYNGVAAFNATQYTAAVYTVPRDQPRVDVIWDDCQKKGYTPSQIYSTSGPAVFRKVPIPDNALPARGTDSELSIYSPETDQLWEFWIAKKGAAGWHACWGGRIDGVSRSKGFFLDNTGVSATGLSMAEGAIGIQEARALRISHAMSLNIPEPAHWSEFSYPAQRSDGFLPKGTANAIQEGQRFRLDPSLDLSRFKLHPLARAVAVAAQKYGFIVNDRGGAVALIGESGDGAVAATGVNPWSAIQGSTASYEIFRNFPWSSMQALPLNYGK